MGEIMIIRLILSLIISIVLANLFINSALGTTASESIAYKQAIRSGYMLKLYPMIRYKIQQPSKQKNMGLALAKARGLRHPLVLPMTVVDPYHQKQEHLIHKH